MDSPTACPNNSFTLSILSSLATSTFEFNTQNYSLALLLLLTINHHSIVWWVSHQTLILPFAPVLLGSLHLNTNIMRKPIRLQGLFNVIVRKSRSKIRRVMNNFKALIMNVDKFMVIVSLRWESPSSAFIRLSECLILIAPRVDLVSSIGLAWLHLERCNQVTCCACLLETKWAKCFSLEDWRDLNEL